MVAPRGGNVDSLTLSIIKDMGGNYVNSSLSVESDVVLLANFSHTLSSQKRVLASNSVARSKTRHHIKTDQLHATLVLSRKPSEYQTLPHAFLAVTI
jgi:hypothetical protein